MSRNTFKLIIEPVTIKDVITYYDESIGEWVDDHALEVKTFKATAYIDGKKINSYVDVYSLFFDIKKWREKSMIGCPDYSVFMPFSCSCGEAGCAGIWDGIYPKVRKHTVEWRVKSDKDGYVRLFDKRFYQFSRLEYELELKNAWKKLNELAIDPDVKVDDVHDNRSLKYFLDRWARVNPVIAAELSSCDLTSNKHI